MRRSRTSAASAPRCSRPERAPWRATRRPRSSTGLIPVLPAVLEFTVTGRAPRSRPGLTIHESARPAEIQHVRGFPVTAPLRALQDLGFPDRPTREALARRLVRPED